ncbi:MAG: ATP-binding protein [Peptococcaceae bacterium]|nr:ATP-binding protein [Peptococcaceae bacterium]
MRHDHTAATALNAFESISLYREFLDDAPGRLAYDLTRHMAGLGGFPELKKLSARLFAELAARAEDPAWPPVGSLWQNYLLDQIVASDNPFTRMASRGGPGDGSGPAGILKAAAAADLKMLKVLLDLDFSRVLPDYAGNCRHLCLISASLPGSGRDPSPDTPQGEILALKKSLLAAPDWAGSAEILAGFHRRCGYGIFCRYHALRWDGSGKKLTGIPDPDPVRLENLVGYEEERALVIENTERLMSGLPAGNILLYGDRGTGKSSTVKALLHRYGRLGLRLIELPRQFLHDYPLVLSAIRVPSLKFIIFVDDLSFDDHEGDYRELKSMLDGSLRANPGNVAVYATSNRRHLVREYFDERRPEVGRSDTVQEKLSLSDRFGMTILFLSPDQELYLKIVESLARQEGIGLPRDRIRLQALEWERLHNCRSGRTARQFVDHLVGRV